MKSLLNKYIFDICLSRSFITVNRYVRDMSEDKIRQNIAFQKYSDVAQIMQPLTDLLGINYFAYRKIYPDGRHIVLTNSPEWLIEYYGREYYKKQETNKAESIKGFYPIIWDYIEKTKFSEQSIQNAILRGFCHSLSLKHVKEDYMELWSLSAPKSNCSVNDNYLRYYEHIKQFTFYFKNKFAPILTIAEQNPIYTNQRLILDQNNKLSQFLKSIEINKLNLCAADRTLNLTEKETLCIKCLLRGDSYKTIAKELNISPRTVEVHITHLKQKLRICSKGRIREALKKMNVDLDFL